MSDLVVTVESLQLSEAEAWAFAKMLKRISWRDWRADLSGNDEDRELLRAACFKVRRAFADAGIAPR